FFSSRRRHTRFSRDWSSDVCSSDLIIIENMDLVDEPTQIIPNVENIKNGNDINMPKPKKKESDGGLKVVFLAILLAFIVVSSLRSEERRVGKECRSRCARTPKNKET